MTKHLDGPAMDQMLGRETRRQRAGCHWQRRQQQQRKEAKQERRKEAERADVRVPREREVVSQLGTRYRRRRVKKKRSSSSAASPDMSHREVRVLCSILLSVFLPLEFCARHFLFN